MAKSLENSRTTGQPRIQVRVTQVIDGQLFEAMRNIDPLLRIQSLVSVADRAIDEALAELNEVFLGGPKGQLL